MLHLKCRDKTVEVEVISLIKIYIHDNMTHQDMMQR